MEEQIGIMLGGVGNMGAAVLEEAKKAPDIRVRRLAFGSRDGPRVVNGHEFELLSLGNGKKPHMTKNGPLPDFVFVMYSPSSSVLESAKYCTEHNIPLVIGTSVDPNDRQALEEIIKRSQVCAVVAPNMAKPIVALQRTLERYAHGNPNALKGYRLGITESHQATKKGTSATAKAIAEILKKAGAEFDGKIDSIRTVPEQLKLGVPKEHLAGHGWHTYNLTPGRGVKKTTKFYDAVREFLLESKALEGYDRREHTNRVTRTSGDGTVSLEVERDDGRLRLTHNVSGRAVYALGTLDAVRFAYGMMKSGNSGRGHVYTMIDVLDAIERKAI